MIESARNVFTDVPVKINNEEALTARLKDAWSEVDKREKQIVELKAQVKILKEIIVEGTNGGC